MKTVLLNGCHSGRKEIAASQGLNFRSRDNLSALEPSDPRPMYVRKFRVLPFCSASAKNQFNIVAVSEDVLNSYFHSPSLYRGTVNSNSLRKSPSATCSSGSREGLIVSERERNTSLAVSGREQGFSTSVSAGEQGLLLGASGRGKISHSMSRDENIVVCPVWPPHGDVHAAVASGVPDHRLPFPAMFGTRAWLPRSCSGPFDE